MNTPCYWPPPPPVTEPHVIVAIVCTVGIFAGFVIIIAMGGL